MKASIAGLSTLLALAAPAGQALAQSHDFLSTMYRFPEQTGEGLYRGICQGCHMQDAKGARGAGAYPALAGDTKLEAGGYPVLIVLHGQKAMPGFGWALSDDQVAAVVNYVRSHFGNAYTDEVTAADVKAARP